MTKSQPTISLLSIALLSLTSVLGCGSDSTSPDRTPTPTALSAVVNVQLDDASNRGDAADLVITFNPGLNAAGIDEYRVMIVRSDAAASFTLSRANVVSADRYQSTAAGGGPHAVTLPAAMTDVDGGAITEGTAFVAFVLSVGGGDPTLHALSGASNEASLAVTSIKITYLGNAGVLVEDDEHRVVIDGLSGNLAGWVQMKTSDFAQLTTGSGPFSDIDVAMASHNHGDHFSPQVVNTFMSNTFAARFIGPPQVTSGLSLGNRIVDVAPNRGSREEVEVNGIRISVLHLRHFDQFGNNFATVENYGFIVHLGGKKILHVGDVDYSAANFEPFDLKGEGIDVVILPTFNTLLSTVNATVVETLIAPEHVIGLHFQTQRLQNESQSASQLFGAHSFTLPMEFFRY